MTNILVVEDMKDINDMVCDIVKEMGHEAFTAADGAVATQYLGRQDMKFDLVILDIIMPEKDGFDVIQFMEANNITTPVLGMSGGGRTISGEIALQSIETKVVKTLKKPFKKEDLMASIKEALNQGQSATPPQDNGTSPSA